MAALPFHLKNRVFLNLTLATAQILLQALLLGFEPVLFGRENEARGRAAEAPAEQIDFSPFPGVALPLREGTSSS